ITLYDFILFIFFFQAEDGIRDATVTGVQTCALPILTAPVLRCPDFNKDFIIECDASKYCVGACLVQEFQGKQHPIAFTSAKLSGAQLHWAAIESEAWAVIHALKKFDAFVYGRRITLVTDNNPLVYITKSMPNSGKLV